MKSVLPNLFICQQVLEMNSGGASEGEKNKERGMETETGRYRVKD